jgi:hypothetical protein
MLLFVSQEMQSDGGSAAARGDGASEDTFVASHTSRVVAMAGLTAATAAIGDIDAADTDNNNVGGPTVTVSPATGSEEDAVRTPAAALSSVASLLTRRNYGGFGQSHGGFLGHSGESAQPVVPSIQDVKKFVFQASRSDKRLLGGLKAHTFSSQAFFSSFAVGLALGSIVAILVRILSEIGFRALPLYGK